MYDIFIDSLKCPNCNTDSGEAEIQTYIRNGSANGSSLPIGFEFDLIDLKTENVLDASYKLVNLPSTEGTIRILDIWVCSNCQTEQWARIEILNQKISSIESVKLDLTTLESVHFISELNAELHAEALLKKLKTDEDSVKILRRLLYKS